MVPYQALNQKKPNIAHLRPFGCTVYAHDYKHKEKGKMAKQGFKCVFLGYEGSNQFRLWDHHKQRLVRRRDVTWGPLETPAPQFDDDNEATVDSSDDGDVGHTVTVAGRIMESPGKDEDLPDLSPPASPIDQIASDNLAPPGQNSPVTTRNHSNADTSSLSDPESSETSENAKSSTPPRRSKRIQNIAKDYRTLQNEAHVLFGHHKRGFAKLARSVQLAPNAEPRTYQEAISCPEAPHWVAAMQEQWDVLKEGPRVRS